MFHSEAFAVAQQIINFLDENMESELLVKRLMTYFTCYNANFIERINHKLVQSSFKGQPYYCIRGTQQRVKSKQQAAKIMFAQDQMPQPSKIETLANAHVKIDQADNDHNKSLLRNQELASQEKLRMTLSSFKNSRASAWMKRHQLPTMITQPSVPLTNPQEKKLPQQRQAQQKLEQQINFLKKRMYFTRKMKKQQQQEQKAKQQKIRKRKSPQAPKSQFTYSYEGQFIKKSKIDRQSEMVSQISYQTPIAKQSIKLRYFDQQQNVEQMGDTQRTLFSRYKKASIFNNLNRRQMSHLPFIKLSSDSKLTQNNRTNKGSQTIRQSLQSYTTSLDQQGFKHHMEIQRQQKIREKQKSLLDDNDQPIHIVSNEKKQAEKIDDKLRRKQAYMMARYLKKISKSKDQNSNDRNNKSLNFTRLNNTQNTSIFKYYKYDFDAEKRKIFEREFAERIAQGNRDL